MKNGHVPGNDEAPLGQTLAQVLVRRWYAVLLPLIVVPAAAFTISQRQPATYEASAKVLIARPELGSLLLGVSLPTEDPIRRAQTERELAGTRAVAARATAKLGLPPGKVDSIAAMIHADVARSDILTVSAQSPSAVLGVRVANAAAKAYGALRRQLETTSISRARARTLAALRVAPQGSQIAQELRARLDRLAGLRDMANDEAVVVEPAVSAERIAPQPKRTAEFGVALGLVIGLALAYLAEGLGRRARSVAEIGSTLRHPVVGEVPIIRRLRRRRRALTPVRSAPLSTAAEAFRFLETNVALSRTGAQCRSILVTSANRREGKTTIAFNLALSAAEAGKKVLLLELDFRNPCLADVTETSGVGGVADVVRGSSSIDDVAVRLPVIPETGALNVVCAGQNVSSPMRYLRSPAARALIREASESFDLVILDVPPLFGFGDAMVAASLADGVLLVVDYRRATRQDVAELGEVARQLPTAVIGIVVNRAPRRPPTPPQTYMRRDDDSGQIIQAA